MNGWIDTRRTEAYGLAALLVTACILWVSFRLHTGLVLEDALITFRYAAHIADGLGYTYNPGERVQGTTTPLLTVMLAAAGWALGSRHIPTASVALMVLAGLAAVGLTYRALRQAHTPAGISLAAAALLAFHRDLLWSSTGGMETPMVLLWMSLSWVAVQRDRWAVAAASCAALVLTRIDGLVWCGLIGLVLLIRLRTAVWKPALLGTILVLPWFAWATWYFGHPLPHSMLAKQAHGQALPLFDLSNTVAFLRWYARPWGMGLPAIGGVAVALFVARLAFVATGASLAWKRRRDGGMLWILPAYVVLFGAAMFIGRAPRAFPWYLVPPLWACIVLGALGASALWVHAGRASLPYALRLGLRIGIVGLTLGLQLAMVAQAFRFYRLFQQNEDGLRKAVGLWLRDHTPPGATVAMEAIGYQGVFSERRIVDLDALTSPEVLRIRREAGSNAGAFARILDTLRPEYLVLRSVEADRNLHFHGGPLFESDDQRRAFERTYQEAGRWTAPHPDLWGDRSRLTVYRRTEP